MMHFEQTPFSLTPSCSTLSDLCAIKARERGLNCSTTSPRMCPTNCWATPASRPGAAQPGRQRHQIPTEAGEIKVTVRRLSASEEPSNSLSRLSTAASA